ncbi:MucBP domain-containing protein [Lactobacillus sp. CC-MHH1034]|uniref:MucBP domain-containing protein n=1 Tax=Agrilactobacillus fermenti TaxID=2586909 RepID=UPI001E4C3DA1|nr:MucBP domain-containing protein [Agrilactobacillus fermenti]MCD2256611.1 MucBP domain-containing protein [Agrilactobacillus fermenti]
MKKMGLMLSCLFVLLLSLFFTDTPIQAAQTLPNNPLASLTTSKANTDTLPKQSVLATLLDSETITPPVVGPIPYPSFANFFASLNVNYTDYGSTHFKIFYNMHSTWRVYPYNELRSQLGGFYIILPASITADGGLTAMQKAADDYVTQLKSDGVTIDNIKVYQLSKLKSTIDGTDYYRDVFYFRPNDGATNTTAPPDPDISTEPRDRLPIIIPIKTDSDAATTPAKIQINGSPNDSKKDTSTANISADLNKYGVLFGGTNDSAYDDQTYNYAAVLSSQLGLQNAPDQYLVSATSHLFTQYATYSHILVYDIYKIVDGSNPDQPNNIGYLYSPEGKDGTTYSRVGLVDTLANIKAHDPGLDTSPYDPNNIQISSGQLTDTKVKLIPSNFTVPSNDSSPATAVPGTTYTITLNKHPAGKRVAIKYQSYDGTTIASDQSLTSTDPPLGSAYTFTKEQQIDYGLKKAPEGYTLLSVTYPDGTILKASDIDTDAALTANNFQTNYSGTITNKDQTVIFKYAPLVGKVDLKIGLTDGSVVGPLVSAASSFLAYRDSSSLMFSNKYTYQELFSKLYISGENSPTLVDLVVDGSKYTNGIWDKAELESALNLTDAEIPMVTNLLDKFEDATLNTPQFEDLQKEKIVFNSYGQVITKTIPFTKNDSHITIQYLYGDGPKKGQKAADDRLVSGLSHVTPDPVTINSPEITGYTPDQSKVIISFTGQTKTVKVYYYSRQSLQLTVPKKIDFGKRTLPNVSSDLLTYLPQTIDQNLEVDQQTLMPESSALNYQLPWQLTATASDQLTQTGSSKTIGASPIHYWHENTDVQLTANQPALIMQDAGTKNISENWLKSKNTGSIAAADDKSVLTNDQASGIALQFVNDNNHTQILGNGKAYVGTIDWQLSLAPH